MNKLTATILDTTGIQGYIFGSNRLRENIGASELVFRATTEWVLEAIRESGMTLPVKQAPDGSLNLADQTAIETTSADSPAVEIVYAGGGNTLLLFRHKANATKMVAHLTHRLLKEAPGLTIVAQHEEFQWDEAFTVREVRRSLLRKLAAHKQARMASMPLLGLSVTAVCSSTGLVANRVVREPGDENIHRMVSEEVYRKLRLSEEEHPATADHIDTRLKALFASIKREEFPDLKSIWNHIKFPYDVDNLGREAGEESYVAVVHADANGMGRYINTLGEFEPDNRAYVREIRKFSDDINAASRAALCTVLRTLYRYLKKDAERSQWAIRDQEYQVPLVWDKEARDFYLPFRPLVFGGDDVTFLTNGRLGLATATIYLQAFEDACRERDLPLYASAGIAIVKMHYPFARAYDFSEALTKSAKKFLRDRRIDTSALDWHFATSGLSGDLGAVRQREYQGNDGTLVMRPVTLNPQDSNQDGRYWNNGIERIVRTFQYGDEWRTKRNKVKQLREPLRQGAEATKQYIDSYDLPDLPELVTGDSKSRRSGWSGKHCIYFDAIELLDHYMRLEAKP